MIAILPPALLAPALLAAQGPVTVRTHSFTSDEDQVCGIPDLESLRVLGALTGALELASRDFRTRRIGDAPMHGSPARDPLGLWAVPGIGGSGPLRTNDLERSPVAGPSHSGMFDGRGSSLAARVQSALRAMRGRPLRSRREGSTRMGGSRVADGQGHAGQPALRGPVRRSVGGLSSGRHRPRLPSSSLGFRSPRLTACSDRPCVRAILASEWLPFERRGDSSSTLRSEKGCRSRGPRLREERGECANRGGVSNRWNMGEVAHALPTNCARLA